MKKLLFLFLIGIFFFSIYLINKIKFECEDFNPKYCLQDSDCICIENPCFLGNKEYYSKCFLPQQKELVKACLDACGFGPEEMEFKTICENNQCRLATFNGTTGERIS